MVGWSKLRKDENGQAALETAIILIAFVVVASVFAFAILSAGSASGERADQSSEGGQATMEVKGAVIAQGTGSAVTNVVFTISPVSGGDPINLASVASDREVVIGYRDATQFENNVNWEVEWLVSNEATADDLLEEGELAEITVDLSQLGTALGSNTTFTLEVKPPAGSVLNISRSTPAAIEAVMELTESALP
jgi:flagellin FlaB